MQLAPGINGAQSVDRASAPTSPTRCDAREFVPPRESEPEVLPEINFPDVLIINNLARCARREDAALVDDVRTVADAERLAHIVVGDQHADAALLEEADDLLDV